ncbi:CehA/McbA family metallohydrolase [Arthrobacter sp. NPDC058192]|uniref:CehA/McbA family metallohydrolase n=1 Tax=Arthrobacter sp. NPDC058192 TaxID=3346372 RepID=UPI0036E2C15F
MRITRLLTPEDRVESLYANVPFEVQGCESLEVLLEYDRSRAVIDLGCTGPDGWRGWSGGAKKRFVISRTAASTGYCPGVLEAGLWNVVLGLHHVPAEGVRVELTINTPATGGVDAEPSAPAPASTVPASRRRSLPAEAGMTWFAGDCHAHTLHSDGSLSIRQLAAGAARNGLDFLAVTDHNTVSHHPHLLGVGGEYGIALLPGQEVTTVRGHANAYGRINWVDFRRHPDAWLDQAEDEGGFLSINHPVATDCSWQWQLSRKPTHAEIMHETWLPNRRDTSIWAWLSAWGEPVIPLGGGDFHRPEDGHPTGLPTTWVQAEGAGEEELLGGLKSGPTALSMGIDAPLLLRVDGELLAVDAEGTLLIDFEGRRQLIRGPRVTIKDRGAGPYRLETADRQILALT